MSHSKIAPSSAAIWGAEFGCTGYVKMLEHFQLEDTEESTEGEGAHEVAAALIEGGLRGLAPNTQEQKYVGSTCKNGSVVTKEMFDGAEVYASHVVKIATNVKVFGGPNLGIEKHVKCPDIHPESHGTVDNFVYDPKNKFLHIFDFKFGYGLVEVYKNLQLINYASGIITELGLVDLETTIVFWIGQPRAYHASGAIRKWQVGAALLRVYWNQLKTKAHLTLSDKAECHSGPHCRYCPARAVCKAAYDGGVQLFEASAAPMPKDMTAADIGFAYDIVSRARKQLEYLESGLEEQIKSLISSGTTVPGWVAQASRGSEQWDKPFEEVINLGDLMSVDLRQKKPITPKQARDAGLSAELVKAYASSKGGGVKLVKNGNKAKQIFGDI